MEAKDGSMGFDFEGTYTYVQPNQTIEYTVADGRTVKVDFIITEDHCKVIEIFEAENTNPIEMQQQGWQSILNNFKSYVESNL